MFSSAVKLNKAWMRFDGLAWRKIEIGIFQFSSAARRKRKELKPPTFIQCHHSTERREKKGAEKSWERCRVLNAASFFLYLFVCFISCLLSNLFLQSNQLKLELKTFNSIWFGLKKKRLKKEARNQKNKCAESDWVAAAEKWSSASLHFN